MDEWYNYHFTYCVTEGCINGDGSVYELTSTVSKSGKACINWRQVEGDTEAADDMRCRWVLVIAVVSGTNSLSQWHYPHTFNWAVRFT